MLKREVEIGATYVVKVSGKLARVRITSESIHGGWNAINVATKRDVRIRGAARLRSLVESPRQAPAIEGGCGQCGGPLVLLGALGDRQWFRCRNCGWEQSQEVQ